ncbi:MAG: hypothetical protein MUC51_05270 [Anaerolineae bacterium]|nr:hypothetical protein [Anaerolineae bacterium]
MALAPVAAAEGPGGTGPDDAMTATGEWKTLSVGDEHWYVFQVPGADKDGNESKVTIEVQAAPVGSVRFHVWDQEGLRKWAAVDPNYHDAAFGHGSAEPLDDLGFVDKLEWAGSLTLPGPYYVCVDQAGMTPAGYAIKIGGDVIASPVKAPQPKPVAPQVARSVAPTGKAGTGPDDAFTATGEWKVLGPGEGDWYVFHTDGADEDGKAPQIMIEMQSTPPGSANFCVWTPEGLHVWTTGSEDQYTLPVGRSAALDLEGGSTIEKSVWSGDPHVGGKYYVCVRQTGSQPTNYSLKITQ